MQFKQYDVVKIKNFTTKKRKRGDVFNKRSPKVGDVATIVELYKDPLGYELECCDANGITEWLIAFQPNEVELELIN